ncbi:DUF3299 domain-containing protein [Methylibium rhizosphaerae]|uniref:DUF3299 domain-containing protein n=1 Tax=Methylibium rhizosphaerae TaxID=2570323 RepID=UPI00112CEBA2|nr:DUF3299 domain-containing protein [Methylibium rhizosphaerae]
MKRRTCLRAAGLALTLTAAAAPWALAAGGPYREIQWDDLMPKDWDPLKQLRGNKDAGVNLSLFNDGDPRAQQMLKDMRDIWDNAPTNAALDGAAIRLPGYVVPLEEAKGLLKEFLLVPYFGACIHSPPPPANQIVHVVLDKPVKGFHSMDTVWVNGLLSTTRQDSYMGVSGYKLRADKVERYVAPPAK